MPSPASQAPQHLYYYIEQPSPERFGQELTAALNRIRERNGDVLHIATQIIPGPDGTARAWTGQIIFSVAADLGDFVHGENGRHRDRSTSVPELVFAWHEEPGGR